MYIFSRRRNTFSNQSLGLHKLYMCLAFLFVFYVLLVIYIRYQLELDLNSMRFNFHQFHKFSFFNSGAWQEISCSVFLLVMIVVAVAHKKVQAKGNVSKANVRPSMVHP